MSFSTWPGYRPDNFWQTQRHQTSPTQDDERLEFSRRLGTLEQRFDIASLKGGQSDTFVLLRLELDSKKEAKEEFFTRLLLAWTRLRAKHPLLASTIHEGGEGLIPGCPSRKFRYRVPKSSNEAIHFAQLSLLRAIGDGNLEDRIEEIKSRYVLNGERVLLEEEKCLARLILVESESFQNQLGFFLVISHVISDGLSVLKLVQELFETAASADLPSPPSLSSSSFLDFNRFLAKDARFEAVKLSQELHEAWRTTLPESEILSSLPLSTEDHLPRLPLNLSSPNPSLQATEAPADPHSASSDSFQSSQTTTSARKRWIWAISRTITLARQRRSPHTLPFPRLEPACSTPPIRTRWEFIRFDKQTTSKLLRFCKLNGQSPSMLLYSMISIATANFYSSHHPPDPYHPILIGFPFSARPLLERQSSNERSTTDPSSDLAIRLTFTSIALPNLPLTINQANTRVVRQAVVRGARLAKSQLSKRLAVDNLNRTIFLAGIDAINTDRLLLRYDQPRPAWEEPKTCINGSMIGDVDRILDKYFQGFKLRLSNLEIGTRLHTGEGAFHEGFTFDGQLQLSGGYDEELVKAEHFWSILNGVKEIGQLIASTKELDSE
ncbi:hypothetical protein JCM3765_007107 [Sporobolomyces pararoseus]